jgi:antitoxin ParD1/3/4
MDVAFTWSLSALGFAADFLKEGLTVPTRNVNLTDHYDSFIDARIAEGRFANASEAVRAGLNLLERQEAEDSAKLEWLRTATKDAFGQLDRGEGISFGSMDELAAYVEQIGEEVSAEIAAARGRT